MTGEERQLLDRAGEARALAYAPYSGVRVGCALRAEDGRVFAAGNVENAAYPATMCAERNAVGQALAAGARRFVAVAVVGDGERATAPCGTCRQVLFEFAPDMVVLAGAAGGATVRYHLARDLLPEAFGPHDLGG
ncbi:MAG: cytidine deaminase [Actinobacteria bacterium]|nr:cytidine deaminase [Actinomycetota bacterium]